jgi:DNA-binding MarR family transcriptional regulator
MDEVVSDYGIISLAGKLRDYANDFIHEELMQEGICDLLPCHGDILYAVFKKREVKVTEIAALTHRSKSTVSSMVDKLRDLGYVTKLKDEHDPRALVISPTQKAEAIMPVFKRISMNLTKRLLQEFTDEELKTLERLLKRAVVGFESSVELS